MPKRGGEMFAGGCDPAGVRSPTGKQHDEYKGMYKLRGKIHREIHKESLIHRSVKDRLDKMGSRYRSPALRQFLAQHDDDWSTVNIVQ